MTEERIDQVIDESTLKAVVILVGIMLTIISFVAIVFGLALVVLVNVRPLVKAATKILSSFLDLAKEKGKA